MQDILVTIITACLASGGMWSLIQYIVSTHKTRETAEQEALRALLHDRIYEECKNVLKRGEVSTEDYDNLQHLFKPYEKLHGNGTCKKLMSEVEDLPLSDMQGKHARDIG